MSEKETLTTHEVAKILSVTPHHVMSLMIAGHLRAVLITNKVMFLRADIDDFLRGMSR